VGLLEASARSMGRRADEEASISIASAVTIASATSRASVITTSVATTGVLLPRVVLDELVLCIGSWTWRLSHGSPSIARARALACRARAGAE